MRGRERRRERGRGRRIRGERREGEVKVRRKGGRDTEEEGGRE